MADEAAAVEYVECPEKRCAAALGSLTTSARAARLLDDFGVHTGMRAGLASGACMRIMPAVLTRPDELERLGVALCVIAAAA
ncbi:hypothetical protein MNO14_16595 [Luteimonas sp. S4-F44]|uniref:hypothetical protein n=1 Tax=Luteimonas sp. S4-F44 TaxID=2925842 RepID=UPI001F53AF71|nr:hypothetical protein [Luteimonas sp. S4-F44]UNK42522.1 hypothetical protein MNO14_16595 [Luteimonas sp. S4-F44]